jgi:hypothetical protein
MTAAGRASVDGALRELVGVEDGLLSGLPTARRAELAGLLRVLLTSFEPE